MGWIMARLEVPKECADVVVANAIQGTGRKMDVATERLNTRSGLADVVLQYINRGTDPIEGDHFTFLYEMVTPGCNFDLRVVMPVGSVGNCAAARAARLAAAKERENKTIL
jgi:hypothetical protein